MTESRQLGVPDRIDVVGRDNRLLTHQGAAATFDADGNLLSIAAGVAPASYTYDARNRLTSAGSLSYGYNAEDRRTSITDSAGTTAFVVNPNAVLDQVLVRTAPDGTKTFYVYGLGLLHEETSGTPRYYHFDRRGDTVALTDGAGAVTDRASYGVYGELLSRTGATHTPFLFNGQWGVQTDDNGLYCHRARYYHPQLRRFLNQDIVLASITVHVGLNQFAYANGNPVSLIDPFGLAGRSTAEFIRNLGQVISTTPITGSGVVGDTITSLGNNLLIQDGNVFNAANATLNPAYAAMTRFAEASSGLGLQCDDLGESLSTRQRIISGALGVVDTASTVFTATGAVSLSRRFVTSAAENAMARGVASEARVLQEMGLAKNTTAVVTAEGRAIPDALTRTLSVEVKDTAAVSLTRQLRIQTDAAADAARQSILVTGQNTRVTGPAAKAFDQIIRRTDLGPP